MSTANLAKTTVPFLTRKCLPTCALPSKKCDKDEDIVACKKCRQSHEEVISQNEDYLTVCCPFCPFPNSTSESDEVFLTGEPLDDVVCPNEKFGCEWTGNLGDVATHIAYACLCSIPFTVKDVESFTMPVIVMMSDFEDKRNNNETWYSPVICTHEKGYNFRLRVDANGWRGTGDAVAVVVSLVKGDHDDQLQWPFEGIITLQILNHIGNSEHSSLTNFEFSSGGYECQRVTDETLPEYGCWCDQFVRHDLLQMKYKQYLKDDCMFFLVTYRSLLVVTC